VFHGEFPNGSQQCLTVFCPYLHLKLRLQIGVGLWSIYRH
jgi:hypothetical protein